MAEPLHSLLNLFDQPGLASAQADIETLQRWIVFYRPEILPAGSD